MLAAFPALGPDRILSPLAAGRMGGVRSARDARLGRDAAVQNLHTRAARAPDSLADAEPGACAVRILSHSNVRIPVSSATPSRAPTRRPAR